MSDEIETCQVCHAPTDHSGEDSIYVEARDGLNIGPLCTECLNGIVHWVASDACISPNQQGIYDREATIRQQAERIRQLEAAVREALGMTDTQKEK
jgi:hypothetical protein